jgi:hypothetical protein
MAASTNQITVRRLRMKEFASGRGESEAALQEWGADGCMNGTPGSGGATGRDCAGGVKCCGWVDLSNGCGRADGDCQSTRLPWRLGWGCRGVVVVVAKVDRSDKEVGQYSKEERD